MRGRDGHSPGQPSVDIADVTARRAIDAPADAALLAITGRAASGKTQTLARRYAGMLARDPTLTPAMTIVTAATAASAAALARQIVEQHSDGRTRQLVNAAPYVGVTLDRLAFDILAEHATLTGLAYDLVALDAQDSADIFARAIAPLFSAEWSEYLGPDIDPEIPGLRAPDRFATSVFRLIGKLRAAGISPDTFLTIAMRGATAFYARPPNLAAPSLLFATKDEHRSALAVDAAELDRQRRRELDLAKIIAKIYRSYLAELRASGGLTPADALVEATRVLDDGPALARSYRNRFRVALVDDAHDLEPGAFALLTALFGKPLAGVTVAGDPAAATRTFAGARPDRIFGAAATTLTLHANYRVPAQIAAVIDALLTPQEAPPIPAGDAIGLHRAATTDAEAAFVATRIAAHIAAGTPPARIAVVHRSLRALGAFEDALVERNIPIALCGDAALFGRHDTLDALGLLWSTIDPFAHGWLLRVLQLPLLGFADATLATLCGEPASAQVPLFDVPAAADGEGSRRWDRRRDLRLGTNVVHGDRDAELEPAIRQRLEAFRIRRDGWQRVVRTTDSGCAARTIVTDGGMYAPRPGETPARTRRRADTIDALLTVIERYATRFPQADLACALAYCDRIAAGEAGPEHDGNAADAVAVAAIERVKGRRFDHVFIVDVRAGSFPPYYVPDAFVFSPTYGMIPKDSVGEALTARTAKFTWYTHQARLRENYAREDRRALAVALARADVSVTVSAAGRPTRGNAAPELLVELDALLPNLAAPAIPRGVDALPSVESAPHHEPATVAPTAAAAQSSAPVRAPIDAICVEHVVAMLRCVRCAPRRTIASAVETTMTLLARRLPHRDERVLERDVSFAFGLGSAVVYGALLAIMTHDRKPYVVLGNPDPTAAALAMYAMRERIALDGFFIETADGHLTGPQPIAIDAIIESARAVLAGSLAPLCAEHQRAD